MNIGAISRECGGAKERAPVSAFKTEFHRFHAEIIHDLERISTKYPLVTLISMVACTLLGFLTIFSFSPTNILSGAILMTIGGALARTIKWNESAFWGGTMGSIQSLFSSFGR